MESSLERRINQRKELPFLVLSDSGREVVVHRAVNLSPTGVLVEHTESDELATGFLRLELFLPGRTVPLQTWARAVWRNGIRAGLEFVHLSEMDRLEIAEWIDQHRD
jgi:hypothetical protein